jgi:hypothetical protein
MPANKIMIIRHGEKPADKDKPPKSSGEAAGVSPTGALDPEELIVRGWQRSGALVRFFAPHDKNPIADSRLATPSNIFASGVGKHSQSLRPQHTVLELANSLGIELNLDHHKGSEVDLAKAAIAAKGVVLISWEHEAIPIIANQILGGMTQSPQHWPGSRFDLVWVFDLTPAGQWTFGQVPQLLLHGDSEDPIPLDAKPDQ